MPIKPSPTIAGKLRKLFNNNKQTIEPAIGDSIPGGSGGGGGGTLYVNIIEKTRNKRSVSSTYILDKTYKEIADAIDANKSVIAKTTLFSAKPQLMPLTQYGFGNGMYGAIFSDLSGSTVSPLVFFSNSEDGEMKQPENP